MLRTARQSALKQRTPPQGSALGSFGVIGVVIVAVGIFGLMVALRRQARHSSSIVAV
jgi:hypothetical protein